MQGARMTVLLSTIGSRPKSGPLLALVLELRALGQEARMCAPPDFRDCVESFGIPMASIGPELRRLTAGATGQRLTFSPEQRRQLALGTVATQFATIPDAARGC